MCPTTGDVSKRPDLREADASTWRRVPAAPSAAMGRVTAKLVAGKAKKRAAAQHEAGLLDDDDIARLGWVEWGADAPGAGNALPEALQAPQAHSAQPQSAKQRRKGQSTQPASDGAPQSWRAVAADPTSLLLGATEDGFLSLEVCSSLPPFWSTRSRAMR